MEEQPESMEDNFKFIVESLTQHLGRLPSEDEVIQFIFGTHKMREEVWNGVIPSPGGGSTEA